MRTRTIGCALLLGLLLPVAGQAQATGRITGVVTSEDGRAVPNAQVTVQMTQLRAVTDTAGRYRIANVPPGQYSVRATSLGDVHSMMLYPTMSSHREISPKHRERMGIRDSLVRLSVGIEAAEDIIGDLEQAL